MFFDKGKTQIYKSCPGLKNINVFEFYKNNSKIMRTSSYTEKVHICATEDQDNNIVVIIYSELDFQKELSLKIFGYELKFIILPNTTITFIIQK